jgi:hypothetical protein
VVEVSREGPGLASQLVPPLSGDLVTVVGSAYLWANGSLMIFDEDGEQIPELQGQVSPEKVRDIQRRSTRRTEWVGFGEDGPPIWPGFSVE